MIQFKSVQVVPNTVVAGGQYLIRVKAKYIREQFKFPLIIPKIIGIIFKRR